MHLQFISDIHLEFYLKTSEFSFKPKDFVGDVLALIGDISCRPEQVREWVLRINPKGKPVLYIPGNHEYYHHDITFMRKYLRDDLIKAPWFHVLDNESVCIDGVNFFGATLWTDFANGQHLDTCELGMADFSVITNGAHPFTTRDALDEFNNTVAWLDMELSRSPYPNVVLTHHAPSYMSSHPRFAGSKLNGGFCSNLEGFITKHTGVLPFWLHGHVHDGVDYKIAQTRVIANPAGYQYNGMFGVGVYLENSTFNKRRCVTIT